MDLAAPTCNFQRCSAGPCPRLKRLHCCVPLHFDHCGVKSDAKQVLTPLWEVHIGCSNLNMSEHSACGASEYNHIAEMPREQQYDIRCTALCTQQHSTCRGMLLFAVSRHHHLLAVQCCFTKP
jgi:hypothetical protein